MNSVKNWVHNLYYKAKQQKVLTGGIIAVLILIGFIVFGGDGNGDREVVTVIREDVVDAVDLRIHVPRDAEVHDDERPVRPQLHRGGNVGRACARRNLAH